MTEERFCNKWKGPLTGFWATNSSTIYWARSYVMNDMDLYEMSVDFLKANRWMGSCSSFNRAKSIYCGLSHLYGKKEHQ